MARRAAAVVGLCASVSYPSLSATQAPAAATSPERAVIARLGEITQLPIGPWKIHVGDVQHGERLGLDDASWETKAAEGNYPRDAVWLRQWIRVPKTLRGYDLTGARIWFQVWGGSDRPPREIIYYDGQRVALGDDMEPVVLFDQARPGDSIFVAVCLPANEAEKHISRVVLRIDFSNGRPNPDDLRQGLFAASVLIPSLSKDTATDNATIRRTAAQVDIAALDAANQAKFDTSVAKALTTLAPLRPLLQQTTIHMTANSHIDAAWLWPWTESVDLVRHTFGTALQLMSEYPDFTYTQSAAVYNSWMADKYPVMNDDIKRRIKEGRWEVVGGMWVEPDLNMPDGESTVRSLLVGTRWYREHYGVDVKIGWNPDSFGYDWQLPQIYKRSGMDYFVTQKMSWNDTDRMPFKLFWWQSPDGSKVLTYFPTSYANRFLNPARLTPDVARARADAPGLGTMMDLYGAGDHGGGATRAMLDEGSHWTDSAKTAPRFRFGTAKSFFESVERTIAPESPVWNYQKIGNGYTPPSAPADGHVAIPTWNDEMYLEYHRGVYTTHADEKRNIRESAILALDAEKYASLAWLAGDAYPADALTNVWKTISFNNFHDVAAGTGIHTVYNDAAQDYDQARRTTTAIAAHSIATLAARVKTSVPAGVPVLVFNPLAWERGGVVAVDVRMPVVTSSVTVYDAAGHVLPSYVAGRDARTTVLHLLVEAKSVPSLGYAVWHVVPGRAGPGSAARGQSTQATTTLENAKLRVVIDRTTGCITSLYDKQSRFESLAAKSCGNALQLFEDKPSEFDAWNIDPGEFDKAPTLLNAPDSVRVIEQNGLRSVVRIARHWQHSVFVQDIVLNANADHVEVVNDIEWHARQMLLKTAFPLAASSVKATFEIPYGTIERPTTRNNSWEKARFEVPALQWADLGDEHHGFSLINESKFGYDALGDTLRLTLLRATTWPDSLADRGHHHFRYALYPHAGTWREALSIRRGYEFNYPLRAEQVAPHAGELPAEHSFVGVNAPNVVLTAMKKAEDADALIFRMYEWKGERGDVEIRVPPGARSVSVVNLMERPGEGATEGPATLQGDRVRVTARPYEIVTVRVDYTPGAL